jgi:transposase
VRTRPAIRLVREHAGDYPTQRAAITAISGRQGMSAETLRKWIRQAELGEGKAPGVSGAEIREPRRKPLPDLRGTQPST